MALTIKFIEENFAKINELFFDSSLKTPRFMITHVKGYLGQYSYRRNIFTNKLEDSLICISDYYDRCDDDIVNTIAHEMIHLYIRQNNIKDTRPHHGKVFNKLADELNEKMGFHIARTDSVKGCGIRNKANKKTFYVVNFYCSNENKYFQFVINKNYIGYYVKRIEMIPLFYRKAIIFKSEDDKAYAHYRVCRKSVRGWYIDKKTYESNKNCEELIYDNYKLLVRHSAA